MEQQYLIDQHQNIDVKQLININVGILGHVDSGKTSLVKVLSQITSTASLDKNPQSQERGITLDLGFSCFLTKGKNDQYYQYTLVDCPGHASLIRTIISGASIIDMMFLVIDVNKGIQTQTAECLVIAELLVDKMFIILNKIDMIEESQREQILEKKINQLKKVFQKTKFNNTHYIPISATNQLNINKLINTLVENTEIPKRDKEGKFLFLIDHCFNLKGKGSVGNLIKFKVTGTVIEGQIKVNDQIQFQQINENKQIKSIQMFKKPVDKAIQGDRVGILFKQLDSDKIERGICSTPNTLYQMHNILISIQKIKFYKQSIKTKQKFHISCGNQTVMAKILLFSHKDIETQQYQLTLNHMKQEKFDNTLEYKYEDQIENENDKYWAILELEKQLYTKNGSLIIGSKLDTDITSNQCRLAFSGFIINEFKNDIKIQREKIKIGIIEKVIDDYVVLVKDLFKKETKLESFMKCEIFIQGTSNKGKIQGSFGKSGKVKCIFQKNVNQDDNDELILDLEGREVLLKFKKYYYQSKS